MQSRLTNGELTLEDYIRKYASQVELNVFEEDDLNYEINEESDQINFESAAANISINSIDFNDSPGAVESIDSIDSDDSNDSNNTNVSIAVQSVPGDSCTTKKNLITINSKTPIVLSSREFLYFSNNAK